MPWACLANAPEGCLPGLLGVCQYELIIGQVPHCGGGVPYGDEFLSFRPASDGWCCLSHVIDLRAPWGKLGNSDVPHPLICHAIDTMAVAELLFDKLLSARLRSRFASVFAPIGEARMWVAFFCGLHDLGKLSCGLPGAESRCGGAVDGGARGWCHPADAGLQACWTY